ncbi:cation transporter, partial [Salmonella enterica subsp. enterica serovar Montevideo]|nr:cation transporter [Salmonella enterica subsp. enterica serovar Montevideo]
MRKSSCAILNSLCSSLTILIIILTYFIEINSVVHGQGVITTKDNAQLISLSKGGTI